MRSPETRRRLVRFLLTGGFNAGTCVLFSALFALVLGAPAASFVCGYALSLTLSYFVNATLVFRSPELSVAQFARFCLSYVPNFLIQLVAVNVLIGALGVVPLIAYTLAVAIAVPLTFVLLSVFTFRPQPA